MKDPTTSRARRRSATRVSVERVYDGELYVRVNTVGEGGIRPFVLVPGIGVSSTYFERLAPRLNEFGPVHSLDLPGFGGVPHPDSALTIPQYADLVGHVIDELGLDDPIVVGHSMGSQVVADLASRRPGLSTLVIIGPVVNPAERRMLRQALRFLQSSWHEPLAVKALALGAYLLCGFKWFSRVLPEMMSFEVEERFPLIRAHTLVIRGEHDAVSPRSWVRRIGELLPSSRLWEIPNAAHSVMHAHADEVARLCVDHARETVADGDDNTVHVLHEASDGYDVAPSFSQVAEAVAGRVVETVGVVRGDDELIERGKNDAARALDAIEAAAAEEAGPSDDERAES